MNWLSNLFGFTRSAAPAPGPVMIMSVPAKPVEIPAKPVTLPAKPATPPAKGDRLRLDRLPAEKLHQILVTQAGPPLIGNNAAGLRHTISREFPPHLTNSAPFGSNPMAWLKAWLGWPRL